MNRARYIVSSILNALAFILAILSVAAFYFSDGLVHVDGINNPPMVGTWEFIFFTIDSNILAALACLIVLIHNIKAHFAGNPQAPIPHRIFLVKMIGTVAVTLTFVTVAVFLGPTLGYHYMYIGANFFMHGVVPLLCIVSYLFVEKGELTFKESLLGFIPICVYGICYITFVVIVGTWPDIYGFNSGILEGHWYISLIAMLNLNFGLMMLEYLPHRKNKKALEA